MDAQGDIIMSEETASEQPMSSAVVVYRPASSAQQTVPVETSEDHQGWTAAGQPIVPISTSLETSAIHAPEEASEDLRNSFAEGNAAAGTPKENAGALDEDVERPTPLRTALIADTENFQEAPAAEEPTQEYQEEPSHRSHKKKGRKGGKQGKDLPPPAPFKPIITTLERATTLFRISRLATVAVFLQRVDRSDHAKEFDAFAISLFGEEAWKERVEFYQRYPSTEQTHAYAPWMIDQVVMSLQGTVQTTEATELRRIYCKVFL